MVLHWKVLYVITRSVVSTNAVVDIIDPLEYNRLVDDTLDLDRVLKPSPAVTELLSCLDRTKVKPWILTNAYITHTKRVLKLLDIERFFDGTTHLLAQLDWCRCYVL